MKQEDVLRKRNIELLKELDEAKSQLAMEKDLNSESTKKAQDLIVELEMIKSTWLKALDEVDEQRKLYKKLIEEVKEFKNSVKGRNAIERWFYDRKK